MKRLLLLILFLSLTGCASVEKKYTHFRDKHEPYHPTAQSVKQTKGIDEKHIDKTYLVSPVRKSQENKEISLVPPGSQLEKKEIEKQQRQKQASTQKSRQNNFINLSFKKAWEKIGKAIHAAGYQVLDQDNGLGTYYILDVKGTGGQIQQSTPIYQLRIIKVKKGVELSLLDSKNQPVSQDVKTRVLGAILTRLKK